MIILAIDPGTVQSAWLAFDTTAGAPLGVELRGIDANADLLAELRLADRTSIVGAVVIEQVASYGMPVGAEVFETVHWAGRFAEAMYPLPVYRIPRKTVCMALCGSTRAKDPNIRRALLDRFGGDSAIRRKPAPGPLYGIHADLWSALALACVWTDMEPEDRAAARLP